MKIKYLLMLIVALTTLILVFCYAYFFQKNAVEWSTALVISVIPSLIATAVTVLAFYFFIERHGITTHDEAGGLKRDSVSVDILKEVISNQLDLFAERRQPPVQNKGVSAFYPSFNLVNWSELIGGASHIDIIVCYYDSWANARREDLISFFRKGGKLRIYLGNPENDFVMQVTEKRFPDSNREKLKEKISNTFKRLEDARSTAEAGHVEGYYIDEPLNYSAVIFDNRMVLLSIYEQFRSGHIASSAILIDINQSEKTSLYWKKELDGFAKIGNKI